VGPIYPLAGETGISVDNPADWITVGVGGVGSYSSISVSQNAMNDAVSGSRSSTVRIGSSFFPVTQAGVDNTYSLSTNQLVIACTSSGTFNVANLTSAVSGSLATAQITSGSDWISPYANMFGLGSGLYGIYTDWGYFSIQVNSLNITNDGVTQDRIGTIVVAGRPITITQRGLDNTYHLSTNQFAFAATDSGDFNGVNVSSSVPGSLVTLQVTNGTDWLSIDNAYGLGGSLLGIYTDYQGFFIHLTRNVTNNAVTQERTGSIDVAGHTVTVTQAGIDNTYHLSTNRFTFAATDSGDLRWVYVSSAVSYSLATVQVITGGDWLSIDNAFGIGGGQLGVYTDQQGFLINVTSQNVTNNGVTQARIGTIEAGGQTITVTQLGTAQLNLTVNSTPGGTATASAISGTLGTKATVTAYPSNTFTFTGWTFTNTGGGSLSTTFTNPTTFTFGYADASITANFAAVARIASDAASRLSRLAIFNKSTGHFQPLPANFIPTGNVYVLAHGWSPAFAASVAGMVAGGNSNPLAWNVSNSDGTSFITPWEALATTIAAKDSNSTILMYSWLDQSATLFPWDSAARAEGMGNLLALTLRNNAGFDPSFYASGGKLHLVGFSHGCEVAAEATADLQAFGTHVDQLTLVDSPEGGWSHGVYSDNMVYVTLNGVQNIGTGVGQTVVDSYLGQQGSFPLPNLGVITHSYGNYHDIEHLTALLNQEGSISVPWAPMVADGNVIGEYFPVQRSVAPQTLSTQGLVSVNPLNTVLTKSADTEWNTAVTTAQRDTSFAFDYQFLAPGDGDQLGVNVDGQLRYLSEGDLAGTDNHTATFDISDLSPGQHFFTFTIYSTGVATSSLSVSNFVVLAMLPPISLMNPVLSASGTFQFGFTNISGSTNLVLVSPSLTLALTNWTALGSATEISSGHFQFIDTQATNSTIRFYRVRLP